MALSNPNNLDIQQGGEPFRYGRGKVSTLALDVQQGGQPLPVALNTAESPPNFKPYYVTRGQTLGGGVF